MKDVKRAKRPTPTADDLIGAMIDAHRRARNERLVGANDLERLVWLVRVTQNPEALAQLPSDEFIKVAREIEAFAEVSGARSLTWTPSEPLTSEAAEELLIDVRKKLQHHSKGSSWGVGHDDLDGLVRVVVPGHPESAWMGPLRAVFLMAVADVLQAEGTRLQICAAAACGKLFVKRKRGKFCSAACLNQEKLDRFIASKGGPEGYSDYRHDKYEQRKSGGRKNLRVPRRKRKSRTQSAIGGSTNGR